MVFSLLSFTFLLILRGPNPRPALPALDGGRAFQGIMPMSSPPRSGKRWRLQVLQSARGIPCWSCTTHGSAPPCLGSTRTPRSRCGCLGGHVQRGKRCPPWRNTRIGTRNGEGCFPRLEKPPKSQARIFQCHYR